jgi:hypothetical protein
MTTANDWNLKIIGEFRANEAASAVVPKARESSCSITPAARAGASTSTP